MFTRKNQLPISNKLTSNDAELFTLIRQHDVRQAQPADQIRHIRAEAKLEQIIASPPASASSQRNPAQKRSLAKAMVPQRNPKWALRLAVIPVAAAALVAASTLLPGPASPPPAFATWTAHPATVDVDALAPAMNTCSRAFFTWRFMGVEPRRRPALELLSSVPPTITDQRGDWLLLGYSTDEIGFAGCLVRMTDGRAVLHHHWMSSENFNMSGTLGAWDAETGTLPSRAVSMAFGGSRPEDLAPDSVETNQIAHFGVRGEGAMTLFSASVGADVTGLEVRTGSGEAVQATVLGGRAVAWWPNLTDSELFTRDDMILGSELGEWLANEITGLTVTLTDGTQIEAQLPERNW